MAFPSILTGAAGRALTTLEPVKRLATHVDYVMAGSEHKVGSRLSQHLTGSVNHLSREAAQTTINSAGDDIGRALGRTRGSALSGELHTATQSIDSKRFFIDRDFAATTLPGSMFDDYSKQTSTIHAGIAELQSKARGTAITRMLLGTSAVGVGIAGVGALVASNESTSRPMAPGPIGGTPTSPSSGTNV